MSIDSSFNHFLIQPTLIRESYTSASGSFNAKLFGQVTEWIGNSLRRIINGDRGCRNCLAQQVYPGEAKRLQRKCITLLIHFTGAGNTRCAAPFPFPSTATKMIMDVTTKFGASSPYERDSFHVHPEQSFNGRFPGFHYRQPAELLTENVIAYGGRNRLIV